MAEDREIIRLDVLDLPGMLTPHFTEVVATADPLRNERVPLTDPRCDFCLEPLPKWEVPCEDFVFGLPGVNEGSMGSWGACDACAALIRLGDRVGLLDRAMIPGTGMSEHDLSVLRFAAKVAQDGFWEHTTGEPRRWE